MERITNFDELSIDEKVIWVNNGKPHFYRFLTKHPRNEKYAIFLDIAEQPIRVYVNELVNFYKNYTDRDLIDIKRKKAEKMLAECDEALKELEETGKTYKVL